MTAPYCPLPLTDKRRAYVPSEHTDVTKTWQEHEPVRVCPIYGDDYDRVTNDDWLEPGGFR